MTDQEVFNEQSQAERAHLLLKDLVEYVKKPLDLVRERAKQAYIELAWQWHSRKDDLAFYKETDLYIFDLTKYQSLLVLDVNQMIEELKERKLKKVLDFGGGIGEYTIRAIKEAGCDVTFLELKDSKTMEYAKHRFTKHGVSPKIVTEEYPWHAESWDVIISMDVIEHLNKGEADRTIGAFQKQAKYIFANPEQIRFNELFSQHITKFTLDGFTKIGTLLWKNKSL